MGRMGGTHYRNSGFKCTGYNSKNAIMSKKCLLKALKKRRLWIKQIIEERGKELAQVEAKIRKLEEELHVNK